MHDFAFIFAGFAVGLIVGLTGVGGGSLMTPILIFFFGVKPYLAVGTDLLFAAFTKLGGTVSLARQRLVPWRVVGLLCAGSIPAALAALWALHHLGPDSAAAQRLMTSTLGVALLLTAAATLYKVLVFSPERAAAEAARRSAQFAHATRRATGACPCCWARSSACWSPSPRWARAPLACRCCCWCFRTCRCRASSPPTLPTPCR
jgi:uncharacterized membrane protein YfcA